MYSQTLLVIKFVLLFAENHTPKKNLLFSEIIGIFLKNSINLYLTIKSSINKIKNKSPPHSGKINYSKSPYQPLKKPNLH
jgi:hypothetical protein